MSKSRRRSSLLAGIDPSNVISPEDSGEICTRRKSLRLSRKSTQFKLAPCASFGGVDEDRQHGDLSSISSPCTHPSSPPIPSPLSLQTTSLLANKPAILSLETNVNSPLLVDCVSHVDSLASHPIALESTTLSAFHANVSDYSCSPNSSPDWIKIRYSPPKLKGLDSIPEGRVLQVRTKNRQRSTVPLANTIRLQVFTGQTLDEACVPNCPGGTRLDPKFVRTIAQRHVRSRQLKAKRLGFRGIEVSDRIERRMARFYRSFRDSFTSPSA